MELEEIQRGNQNWISFSSLFVVEEETESYKKLLVKLNNMGDVANVIYLIIGEDQCLKWIEKEIPAIKGSVLECIINGQVNRVKMLLMRM